MKNLLLIFLILPSISYAQFGIKAGVNLSSFYFKNVEGDEFTSKTGFSGGAYYNLKSTDKVGFMAEFLYNSLGAGYEAVFTTGPTDPGTIRKINLSLDFVSINALINFKPVKFIQLEGGPGFAMKINSSHELYNQNMDWQVMAGIAGLPDEKIKIGVRYVHGFHPMLKETLQSGGTEYSNTYNRAIQFYAAYDLF